MRLPSFNHWAGAFLALTGTSFVHAQTYDAIVVGSGPGGLVAAEYLSRDASVSVLILEAGPRSLAATGGTDSPDYAQGRGLTKFDIPGEYDPTIYNPANEQYRVEWISDAYMWLGKLVGGCSSINAALYFRPPDAYVTNMQWPFSAAQMVSKMDENEQIHGHTDRPSTDGTWYTQEGYSIVSRALLATGYAERTINDAAARNSKSKTFGHAPFTIKNGKRDTPANAFWSRMSGRSNVRLLTGAKVDYIIRTAGGKATGVVYNGGTQVFLTSRGTVLMAAGALSTPKVLIQSGVGPSSQLNLLNGRNGFPGVSQAAGWVTNANIGRNLFDTNVVFASFSHPQMSSFQYKNKPSWAINQYMNQGFTGPWSSSGPTLISYENYDVQGRTYQFQATALTTGFGDFYSRSNAFTLSLYVNNPESRAASGFDGNGNWKAFNEGTPYFGTNRDLAALQSYAQRTVSAMVAQGATFLSAAADATSVANWVSSNRGFITHHFGGSCYASSNAADSNRCADEKLRVIGLTNVFVADGSAMRDGTVNPYGFIMYIGREAADQAKTYITANTGSTGTCSAVENNVDYLGNDLTNKFSAAASGCCSICAGTSGCKAYTWSNYGGGTCWLKSAKGNTQVTNGVVSATLNGGSTPTCPTIEENVDYTGNDIANALSGTAEGCCAICRGRSGCNAYTWTNYNTGTCWLKSGKGAASTKTGARSAQLGPSSSTCTLVNNVDYAGNDIGNSLSATATGCCELCRGRAGCKLFTWTNYGGGTCWLKSLQGAASTVSGAVSGTI
ncbi:Carbohydrate-binding protein [Phytophthora megakarya]|uniref:Carbohydrate-binding protein n=1 Tax=Phytophthora megakarya TaxID=4795 RepID=A0A225VTE7_9STRA|nr:Carbohydrate-binding protein [Phytophthora megakarya]